MENERIIFRQGKKVDLVILEIRDIPLFLKWFNDPEVTQFILRQDPMLEAQEEEWFANLPKRMSTDPVFGIATKEGKLIGNVGLHKIDHRHGTASGGAVIGEKDFWGKGYGSEAEYILARYAFIDLNLRKVSAGIFSTNSRSLKAALKNGAVEEGRKRAQYVIKGQLVDEIMVAVFRDDFLKLIGVEKQHKEERKMECPRPFHGGYYPKED